MSSAGDDENDAILSDVEEDAPAHFDTQTPDKLREILAELDRERAASEAAESEINDIQVSSNRLKVLCHEAIRKRNEALREREEALKKLETVNGNLSDEIKEKDEALRQLDELRKSRAEIETGSFMLVSGMEKISKKVIAYKDFGDNGLPRSNKYSGLPATAYGVIKRTNDIVVELLSQIESSNKSRNEARQFVEQRNYETASEEFEKFKRSMDEKDGKVAERERESSEKLETMESVLLRLRIYESKMEAQRPLLMDQLNYLSRMHGEMREVLKIVDADKSSELSESLFLAQETNMEENIKASLAGMESVYELSKIVVEKTRNLVEERSRKMKSLNESVSQLVKEKERIGSLLRSTLSRRTSVDLSSKTNQLFKVAESGLKEAGIDYKFSKFQSSKGQVGHDVTEESEVYALASALENIVKQSQLEIIVLKHSEDELRAESNLNKERVDSQSKELNHWKQRVEELEEKERVVNENVEALMMDITAAEEEIMRWKVAAQQEADAGKAVEQDYVAQLETVRQELNEALQAVTESENKLSFKEATAEAAMAARDAAENSLSLADMRTTRLRDRVEELTRQLDELDTRETTRSGSLISGPRYICWPWQCLGLEYVGRKRLETPPQTTNEMELSEPLL